MVSTLPRATSASAIADFTTPLTLPGGTVSGAELVRELPADVALPVWHTLRSVLLWTQVPPGARAELFGDGAMEAWEAEVLTGALEEAVRSPLAVIARELSAPEEASPQQIAWACFCVTEWALGRRATATAMVFAEAAALAWPEHPRYAWAAGRLMRTHGKLRDAEIWMRRAIRTAIRCSDWESQVLGLNSLGNVLYDQGNFVEAQTTLQQGLHLARRRRFRRHEAELSHDLFVLAVDQKNLAMAEHHAQNTVDLYREMQHPRLILLAHDLAYLWMEKGYYARALAVFLAMMPNVEDLPGRVRVLANTARAAAACGDASVFDDVVSEARQLLNDATHGSGLASAFIELSIAAWTFSDWRTAEELAQQGLERARRRREASVIIRADGVVEALTRRERYEIARAAHDHPCAVANHALVHKFVESLQSAGSAEPAPV
jgi:tetratricopeptide (TPR) repeat protein